MWPTPQEFNEAIQRPDLCFEDPELKLATVSLNPLGLPRSITGSFASVYKLRSGNAVHAVRCFLEDRAGLLTRYAIIEESLAAVDFEDFVRFRFMGRGIKVSGRWYPILKMDWCEGLPLDQYLNKVVGDYSRLDSIQSQFRLLMKRLYERRIAHGDLQHGNILIEGERMVLVDYDGMFVPRLSGSESVELGHRNFQHPRRNSSLFSGGLDNFSAHLIDTSLSILKEDPDLWSRFECGDDCLLFRHRDLRSPEKSALFAELSSHESEEVRRHGAQLTRLLKVKPEAIPDLSASSEELEEIFADEENLICDRSEISLISDLGIGPDDLDVLAKRPRRARRHPRLKIPRSLLGRVAKLKENMHMRVASSLATDIWAENCISKGISAYDEGNYSEAIQRLKPVPELIADRSDYYHWSYEANVRLGYCYIKTNQIGTASHYFREAQRYASVLGSSQSSMRATLLLAATYYESDQLDRSYDLVIKSLKKSRAFLSVIRQEKDGAFGNKLTIPNLLLDVGHLYLSRDELESAIASFEALIEFCQRIESTDERSATEVKLLVLRAITAISVARFENDGDRVIELFRDNIRNPVGLSTLLEAENAHSRLLTTSRYALFLREVAERYYQERQYKYSKIAYQKALELFRKLPGGSGEFNVYIADCLLAIGKTPEAAAIMMDSFEEGQVLSVDLLNKLESIYEFHFAVFFAVVITDTGGYKRRNRCLNYLSEIAPTGESLALSLAYLDKCRLNRSKNLAVLLADCARDLTSVGRGRDAQEIYATSFRIFQRAGLVDADAHRVIECLLVNDDLDTAAGLLVDSPDLEHTVRAIVGATMRANHFELDLIFQILVKVLDLQMARSYEHVSEDELKMTLSLLSWCAEEDDIRLTLMEEKVETWRNRREITLAHNLVDQGKFGRAINIFEKHEGKAGVNVVQAYELWSMRYFTIALENRDRTGLALVDGYALGCAIEIISTLKERDGLSPDFAMRVVELIGRSSPEGMENHLSILSEIFEDMPDEFEEVRVSLGKCVPSTRRKAGLKRPWADVQDSLEADEGTDNGGEILIGVDGGFQAAPLPAVVNMRFRSTQEEKLWKALHRALFLVDRERYGEAVKALTEFENMDRGRRFLVDAEIALGYCQYLLSNARMAKSCFSKAVAESRSSLTSNQGRVESYYRASVCLAQFALGKDLSKGKIRTLIDPSAQRKDIYRVGAALINETIELESDLALRLADHLYMEAEEHESLQHGAHASSIYEAALVIFGAANNDRALAVIDCLDAVRQHDQAARKLKELGGQSEDSRHLLRKLARRHVRGPDCDEVIAIYEAAGIELSIQIQLVEQDLIMEKLARILTTDVPSTRYMKQLLKEVEDFTARYELDAKFAAKIISFCDKNIDSLDPARRPRLKGGFLDLAEFLEPVHPGARSALTKRFEESPENPEDIPEDSRI